MAGAANIRRLGAVLLLLLATGCAETDLNTPTGGGRTAYDPSKVIAVTTQVSSLSGPAGPATRGTPVDNVSQMTTLGLFCSYSAKNTYDTTVNKPVYMFNEQLELHADGFWYYSGTPLMWWGATYPSTVPAASMSAADHYTFFAYAPFATASNGIVVTSDSTKAGIPTMSYTVPTNVLNQPDLMLAVARPDIHPTGHPVALQMKHALTAVGFTIVGNGEQVTGISISGVSTYGELKMDGSAIAWTNVNAPQTTDFSASIAFDSGETYKTATSTQTQLITGDGYLMMVPQTFDTTLRAPAPKPLMTISFVDGTTRVIDMTDFPQWTAGERITYNIILTPAGIITVTPPSVELPYAAQSPAAQSLTVTCLAIDGTPDPTIEWMLTSAQPWLTLSLDPGGAGAAASVSGVGSQPVYLVATENPDAGSRSADIFLNNSSTNVVSTVNQDVNLANIPGAGTAENVMASAYSGVFWRAGQTGERIIKNIGAYYDGTWTATVAWTDARWSPHTGDGIVLSTDPSGDPNIYTGAPGDAESYQVGGTAQTVSGTVAAGGDITFRIGLQEPFSEYSDTPDYASTFPARYAVILLAYKYSGATSYQKIFIRQGEGADYLMRPQDPITSDDGTYSNSTRMAVRFSPYNLTDPNKNTETDYTQMTSASTGLIGYRGGVFVDYPSKAGYFFQYDTNTYAFMPTGTFTTWPATAGTWNWDVQSATDETCPPNYRRPLDAIPISISGALGTGTVDGSETRQSLWLYPPAGVAFGSRDNFVMGFYADGYFDRRPLGDSPAGQNSPGGTPDSNVAYPGPEVAYRGQLLYNLNNNASLFFPCTGYRYSTNGVLDVVGSGMSCWTGTPYSADASWYISYFSGFRMTAGTAGFASGFPVRCVHE